jgi:hypothetical protein
VLVALGACDGSQTGLGDTHEVMSRSSGTNGINSRSQAAVGTILEANGEGQTRGKLTVELRLCGASADGTDGDAVCKELRRNGIEHLAGNRHLIGGQVDEELTRDTETLVDLEGVVDIGIVDETFPADSSTRLLEVGTHDDTEIVLKFVREALEAGGIFVGGLRVMNRAGADNDEKAVALAHDNLRRVEAALDDSLDGLLGHGNFGSEQSRRDQRILAEDCNMSECCEIGAVVPRRCTRLVRVLHIDILRVSSAMSGIISRPAMVTVVGCQAVGAMSVLLPWM